MKKKTDNNKIDTSKTDVKVNPLHLNQQLCFALYSSSRLVVQAYDTYLKQLNLTYPQFLVLLALWQKNPLSVKEIGESLHLDSGTLSPLVKKMQSKGLVKKNRSNKDERIVTVQLTPSGKNMQKAAAKIPHHIFCKLQMKEKEVIDLRKQLQTLTDVLKNTDSILI